MVNVRKHTHIKLVTTEKKCLASESNYHTINFFTENLLAIEIKNLNIHE